MTGAVPWVPNEGRAGGDFVPMQVRHLELSTPLRTVPVLAGSAATYTAAMALVRLHGHPLGTVTVPLAGADADPEWLARVVWARLSEEIREHCRDDGRLVPERLGPEGLPPGPCLRPLGAAPSGPFVSVVVPTLARPASLRRCLASLLAMDFERFEVIVVDNAPEEPATRAVVEEFAGDVRLRCVDEPRRGGSRARNRGLQEVGGPLVAFTDDDVVVDRHWLSALVERFAADPAVACVTGLVLPARLDSIAQQWFEEYGGFGKGFRARDFAMGGAMDGDVFFPYAPGVYGSGNNVAFRTAELRALGGYDVSLGPGTPARSGEDLALLLSVVTTGRRLGYEPSAIVHHDHRESRDELLDQLHDYGVGLSAMLTGRALSSPHHLRAIARRVPSGVRAVVDPASRKNAKRSATYPPALSRAEMRGLLLGPLAYVHSRVSLGRASRSVGRVSRVPQPQRDG